jgi:hypothetical protein
MIDRAATVGKGAGLATMNESGQLTGILRIVQSRGQDLKGPSKVHEVELVMQGNEHLNWLICHCGRLAGHLWQLVMG